MGIAKIQELLDGWVLGEPSDYVDDTAIKDKLAQVAEAAGMRVQRTVNGEAIGEITIKQSNLSTEHLNVIETIHATLLAIQQLREQLIGFDSQFHNKRMLEGLIMNIADTIQLEASRTRSGAVYIKNCD